MSLLSPRGYQLFCHAMGLLNAWNMVDSFYEGHYLLGIVSGAVMLMVAHASVKMQRLHENEGE